MESRELAKPSKAKPVRSVNYLGDPDRIEDAGILDKITK